MGGCAGRHGELSPRNRQVVWVAGRVTRFWVGFRERARETVLGGEDAVHRMAGQGWHRDSLWVPCRCAWRGELGEAQVHRNAMHALRALGDPMTSTRHGRGGVHGGSRRFLLLGKGSPCRGRPGGEMTGMGVVGCLLAKRRCPRWPCRRPGGRGVLEPCHCKMGPGLGF
jgi:hypothetical protein